MAAPCDLAFANPTRQAFEADGKMSLRVQAIFDLCRNIFVDSFHKKTTLEKRKTLVPLVNLINELTEKDVGIDSKKDWTVSNRRYLNVATPPVLCQHIYENDQFALDIFILPQISSKIPLHDHPGMIVASKVLFGEVKVNAFDWEEQTEVWRKEGLAHKVHDATWTTDSSTSVLYPNEGGNLHSFTALTPCAFFDVIAPPYSESRLCTYYKEQIEKYNAKENEKSDRKYLVMTDEPDDWLCIEDKYTGPLPVV